MNKRQLIYKIVGILLCTLPASIATLSYFPLWMRNERSAVSVLSVAVLCLCAIPFKRAIGRALRSPSAWQMWLVLWIGLTMLNAISDGLRAVSAVAFPTSLLGAVFFWLARREEKRSRINPPSEDQNDGDT